MAEHPDLRRYKEEAKAKLGGVFSEDELRAAAVSKDEPAPPAKPDKPAKFSAIALGHATTIREIAERLDIPLKAGLLVKLERKGYRALEAQLMREEAPNSGGAMNAMTAELIQPKSNPSDRMRIARCARCRCEFPYPRLTSCPECGSERFRFPREDERDGQVRRTYP